MPELNKVSLLTDANLIAYWRLNGNFTDEKGSYNLTGSGSVNDIAGIFGQGKDFAGGYASNAGLANFGSTAEFTVGCWFKLDVAASAHGDAQYLLSKQDAGTRNFELSVHTNDKMFFSNATGAADTIGNATINANVWYFGVATRQTASSGTNKIYINGAIDVTQTNCGNNGAPTSNLFMGAAGNTGASPMNGKIDDAFIFNRALTAAEVAMLFNIAKKGILL